MNLTFSYLPGFAAFIRDHCLEAFTRLQIQVSRKVQLPLLKFFESMPEESLVALSMASSIEMLNSLEENRVEAYIEISQARWVSDQLPLVGKFEIRAEDITLASYIRNKGFFHFIPQYTSDPEMNFRIRAEIHDYALATDTASTNTYINLLKDRINETEAALLRREEQLQEAEELAALGSFEWNITDKTAVATPQVSKILGVSAFQDLDSFLAIVHPSDHHKIKAVVDDARNRGEDFECEYRVAGPEEEKIVWMRGSLTHVNGNSIVRGTIMDVTGRNRLLRDLQRSEVLYKQTQAMAHIGSWTWDLISDELVWTDELFRIYGMEPGSVDVKHAFDIRHFNHPDDDGIVHDMIRKARESGAPVEFNYRIILEDRSVKMVNARCEINMDEGGRPIKMFGTLQDVTQQKRTEQELVTKSGELEKTNLKLQKFASVASHDLQEPLRKVIMFTNLLEKELGPDLSGHARMFMDKVTDSTSRMQHLINDILRFSSLKSEEVPLSPVDLRKVIRQVLSDMVVLRDTTGAEVSLGSLPVIEGSESQLGQLFQNLISNSIKFRKEHIRPVIRIHEREPDPELIGEWMKQSDRKLEMVAGNGYDPDKRYCCIVIEDNGIGFEEVYLDRIFQIFQRLNSRDTYEGTGIGLAVCKRVVENHKGFITARSKPGEGAVFMILLPASAGSAPVREVSAMNDMPG